MRWQSGRRSNNIEDRRGRRVPGGAKGGGIGIMLLALAGMYFFNIDPSIIMNIGDAIQGGDSAPASTAPYKATAAEQEQADFVSVVLASGDIRQCDTFKTQRL